MNKILVCSHGSLAKGLLSSLQIIMGNLNNIDALSFYENQEGVEDLKRLEKYLEENQENDLIVLSDLYGGSVNQKMYTYLTRPNTFLVAGVNLALVLELVAMSSCGEFTKESLETTIANSREALKLVELDTSSETETEDEFF